MALKNATNHLHK